MEIWLQLGLALGLGLLALADVLGGIVSSTATTVTYARQSRTSPDTSALAALVIMIASRSTPVGK